MPRSRPRTDAPRARPLALAALAALALRCRTEHAPSERTVAPRTGESLEAVTVQGLRAGPPGPRRDVRNPFEGNVHALAEGERLYAWFNCAGCHGAIGGGSIGPPLRDADWIYGSDPDQIYRSIVEGRPNGMPAFGRRVPEDAVWKIAAFVRSLGGAPAAREEGAVAADPAQLTAGRPRPEERRGE